MKREAGLSSEERTLRHLKIEKKKFKEQYREWRKFYEISKRNFEDGKINLERQRRRPRSVTRAEPFHFRLD
jgi:hypothetical protein